MVARYFSSLVQAPVQSASASSLSRQLVVDTNMSVNSQPVPASLLRSLSAHTTHYQSQQQQRLLETTGAASSPPRGPHATTVRQMSCPEPSSAYHPSAQQRTDFTSEHRPADNWRRCVVSHVNDPENFYCQLIGDNNAERLEAMMSNIQDYVAHLPPGIGKLRSATLGQPVIAKYSDDDTWYRARVTGRHLHCLLLSSPRDCAALPVC